MTISDKQGRFLWLKDLTDIDLVNLGVAIMDPHSSGFYDAVQEIIKERAGGEIDLANVGYPADHFQLENIQ